MSIPRLLPGEDGEKAEQKGRSQGSGGGGRELAAVAACFFACAVVAYAFAVSHAARWGVQVGFLLSKWALYLVLIAAAVACGNALGTRLYAVCASSPAKFAEPAEFAELAAPPRKAEPSLPTLEGPADHASPADAERGRVAPAALVELGSTTLRELQTLRDARQPTAASDAPTKGSGAKSKGVIRMLSSGGRGRAAAMV